MATSQNGYQANNRGVIGSYALPGGKITARVGDVSVVLLYVANRFHNEVEGLVWPGNWGYAERTIRGSSTQLSNHASGTAIDLNAPRHPLGKSGTFNSAQRAKIREILNFLEGVVRWGGDYTGRKDEMHFEINKGSAEVARIANKIRGAGGVVGGTKAPVPATGSANPDVKWIQERLNYWGFNAGTADGINGPKTKAAVVAFQRAKGLSADGIVGPKTRAALSANKPAPAPAARPILRRGSKGQAVKDLQQRLKTGYPAYARNIGVDGDFGPATERIVKEFQRRSGLKADGIVGPATYRKLGL